jgi:hypothetical protein
MVLFMMEQRLLSVICTERTEGKFGVGTTGERLPSDLGLGSEEKIWAVGQLRHDLVKRLVIHVVHPRSCVTVYIQVFHANISGRDYWLLNNNLQVGQLMQVPYN